MNTIIVYDSFHNILIEYKKSFLLSGEFQMEIFSYTEISEDRANDTFLMKNDRSSRIV